MSSGVARLAGAFGLSAGILFSGSAFTPLAAQERPQMQLPAQTPAEALALSKKCGTNPLVGTWRLSKTKSKITRHNGEIAGRIVIIAPYGDNGITYIFIDDDDPRLSGREETWSVQFDGKSYPTKGGDPRLQKWARIDCNTFDFISLRQLIFNMPEGTVKQYIPEGQAQSRAHIVVAADGKSFTDVHSGMLGDQTPYDAEVLYFDRL